MFGPLFGGGSFAHLLACSLVWNRNKKYLSASVSLHIWEPRKASVQILPLWGTALTCATWASYCNFLNQPQTFPQQMETLFGKASLSSHVIATEYAAPCCARREQECRLLYPNLGVSHTWIHGVFCLNKCLLIWQKILGHPSPFLPFILSLQERNPFFLVDCFGPSQRFYHELSGSFSLI